MALGSTQPLTEMSTRSISWGTGGRCVRLTTLPPSCAVVTKSGKLNFLEPSGSVQACNGTALPLPLSLTSQLPALFPHRMWLLVSYYPQTKYTVLLAAASSDWHSVFCGAGNQNLIIFFRRNTFFNWSNSRLKFCQKETRSVL